MPFPSQKKKNSKGENKIFNSDFSSSHLQVTLQFKVEVICILISGKNDRKLNLFEDR